MLAIPLLAASILLAQMGPTDDPPPPPSLPAEADEEEEDAVEVEDGEEEAETPVIKRRPPQRRAPAKKPSRRRARAIGAPPTVSPDEAPEVAQDVRASLAERQQAVRVIAFRALDEDLELLSRLLIEDPEVSIRFLAARALERSRAGGPELAQALTNDPDPRVRRAAARALGRMGPDGTRQETALVIALEDPAEEVGREAAMALRRVGSRASIEGLRVAAKRGDARKLRSEARRALRAVKDRQEDREEARERAARTERFKENPRLSNPFMMAALRYGGTAYSTVFGAVFGSVMGGLLPLALGGARWGTFWWPIGAGAGALVGAGAGFGYGAARLFRLPVTDAMLISAHAASGTVAGLGLGLAMGKRHSPQTTAGLGMLGGTGALLLSSAASPFMRARPSSVLGTTSGAFLGGATALLAAGAFGVDAFQQPDVAMGIVFVGQGIGALTGTVLTAGVPITAQDIVLVDLGAVLGGAATTGLSVALLGFGGAFISSLQLPAPGLTNRQVNGVVLGGVILGAGAGALLGAILPNTLENRLESGLDWGELPFTLAPTLPVPNLLPDLKGTGVNGASFSLVSGTFR